MEVTAMKLLHILKSEPDETVESLITVDKGTDGKRIAVYEGDVDWAALVDDIFDHDKVICWW
jgi:hypothetical protein